MATAKLQLHVYQNNIFDYYCFNNETLILGQKTIKFTSCNHRHIFNNKNNVHWIIAMNKPLCLYYSLSVNKQIIISNNISYPIAFALITITQNSNRRLLQILFFSKHITSHIFIKSQLTE